MRRIGMILVALALALAAPASARAQVLRVEAGGAVTRAGASYLGGFAVYTDTLLVALGADLHRGRSELRVVLFGDTLRFRDGYPDFLLNEVAIPLHNWSYVPGGTLYLPARFFTEWLPSRYPERLELVGGTLRWREGATTLAGSTNGILAPAGEVVPEPTTRPRRNTATPPPPPSVDPPAPTDSDPVARRPPTRAARPVRVPAAVEEDPEAPPPSPLIGFIDSRVSGVSDSNIDHEEVPTAATGTVTSLAVGIQSARSRPFLSARYDFRHYRFANSARWNRATHEVRAALAPSLPPFQFELEAAVRIGSWTEDRELADQVILRPSVELRASRNVFLTVHAAQRVRSVTVADAERADTSRLVGIELARRWRGGGRVELESRYEDNGSQRPTSRYTSWSGRGMLRLPLTAADRLTLELVYRERQYLERPVGEGDGLADRRDRRWTPSAGLTHDFGSGHWIVMLDYELELNRSTETGAGYQAHRFALTLRRRW